MDFIFRKWWWRSLCSFMPSLPALIPNPTLNSATLIIIHTVPPEFGAISSTACTLICICSSKCNWYGPFCIHIKLQQKQTLRYPLQNTPFIHCSTRKRRQKSNEKKNQKPVDLYSPGDILSITNNMLIYQLGSERNTQTQRVHILFVYVPCILNLGVSVHIASIWRGWGCEFANCRMDNILPKP